MTRSGIPEIFQISKTQKREGDAMTGPKALSFYHSDGLVPAWNLASIYAGEGGHLATIPDIIDARLKSDPSNPAWQTWFTTASYEMVGRSRAGKLILIVVHKNVLPNMHVGITPKGALGYTASPQTLTKEWVTERYSFEYKDKKRDNHGGRISREEFLRYEKGAHGWVAIVDLDRYIKKHDNRSSGRYPFLSPLQSDEAFYDELVQARLGTHYPDYIALHRKMAIEFEKENNGIKTKYPYILQMRDAANCSYRYFDQISPDGTPLFHLLSISGMNRVNFCEYKGSKLITEVSAHEWGDGAKFAGVPKGCWLEGIFEAPDSRSILRNYWGELWEATKVRQPSGLYSLMTMGEQLFTMYEKQGDSMDSHEPEFLVRSVEKLGNPVLFVTPITGYYGFFTYDLRDLRKLAPVGANAYYLVDEPGFADNDHHKVSVQFCFCEVDLSQRLPRASTIGRNSDLIMKYAVKS